MDERYAVVSCHVERLLDDPAWAAFSRLQLREPHGFRIAALVRPPDEEAGEDAVRWLERARIASRRGPLGLHTHWGGPEQARPHDGDPAALVRRQASWLREQGLEPTVFCGGGWYLDEDVAEAVAEAGFADCTGTAFRPGYLAEGAPRLQAERPCTLGLPGGRSLLELPTTHSLGMLLRAAIHPGRLREPLVHAYFHDTELLVGRRTAALWAALALLARRRVPSDLDRVVLDAAVQELPLNQVFAR